MRSADLLLLLQHWWILLFLLLLLANFNTFCEWTKLRTVILSMIHVSASYHKVLLGVDDAGILVVVEAFYRVTLRLVLAPGCQVRLSKGVGELEVVSAASRVGCMTRNTKLAGLHL